MPNAGHAYKPERLVAYSDAIFSIALTLLVIELRLPEDLSGGLLPAVAGLWPQLLSTLISFLIITVVWFNHHEMFHHVQAIDYRAIIFNTLLMLNIVLIPFAASLLGRCFGLAGLDAKLACFGYGLWIAVGGIPFNLLWGHVARRPELLRPEADPALVARLRRHYRMGPFLYAAAAAGSFAGVWVGVGLYAVLIGLYFVPGKALADRRRKAA